MYTYTKILPNSNPNLPNINNNLSIHRGEELERIRRKTKPSPTLSCSRRWRYAQLVLFTLHYFGVQLFPRCRIEVRPNFLISFHSRTILLTQYSLVVPFPFSYMHIFRFHYILFSFLHPASSNSSW